MMEKTLIAIENHSDAFVVLVLGTAVIIYCIGRIFKK